MKTTRIGAWIAAGIALVASSAVAPPAFAGKKECANAYVEAQKLKKDGAFRKARQALIACSKDECMAAVKKDCVAWLDEVNASIPSVVIAAKGPDGKETFDVKVSVDGEVLGEKLGVKAIELDPGTHQFKFEFEGEDPIEQEVIVRQGERNKEVSVSFAKEAPAGATPSSTTEPETSPAPEPDKATKKSPVLAYVLGGVGVVALGGTAFFWLGSESKKKDLENSGCSPNCAQSDVDSIKQKRLFGDIALGVGAICIGTAAYLLLSPAKSKPPPSDSARLDVRISPSGAYAGVLGQF
jgi:hypothetical protein